MNMLNNLLMVAGETGVTDAFTQCATDLKEQISTITPIAVGVITASMVVTFGIKFFRKIVKA